MCTAGVATLARAPTRSQHSARDGQCTCFDSQSTAVQAVALAVAAAHALPALHFCARNALLCLRNVEYSEDELASLRRRCPNLSKLMSCSDGYVARHMKDSYFLERTAAQQIDRRSVAVARTSSSSVSVSNR